MDIEDSPNIVKPLAGSCEHQWLDQESPYLVSQLCKHCRLYRYKVAPISDWEYRAPIPRSTFGMDNT
ncbi:MAG TPA: hypothetical protein VNM47_14550 [Terriglobia bacterium]|nr:hypothetical protein [Terriglobia bacterium]